MKVQAALFLGIALMTLLSACSAPLLSNTPRTAVEQMITTAVIERSIQQFDAGLYSEKKFFLDYEYLAPQVDKPVVQGYLELHLANSKIVLTKTAEEADFILKTTCAVLGTDQDKFLLGTPTLPVPIPYGDITFAIPEIQIFMKFTRSAYGRFYFTVYDAKTHEPVETIAGLNARAEFIDWTVLLFPFRSQNVYLFNESQPANHYMFPWD